MKSWHQRRHFWRVTQLVALLLAMGAELSWAWSAAGGSFANFWLTPDQQGQRRMAQEQLDCIHSGPGSATLADDLLAHHSDADLRRHVEALQAVVLRRDTSWNGMALAAALHRARREGRQRQVSVEDGQLPALNPH